MINGISGITLLFSVMGYFLYGGLNGALIVFTLCVLCNLAIILSLIPIFGLIFQYWIMANLIFPWFFEFTGTGKTLLTLTMFTLYFCIGIIYCSSTTFWLFKKIVD